MQIGIPIVDSKKNILHTHTVPAKFVQPPHPLHVVVIGAGGSGSQLLTRLASMNYALHELGHRGIHVHCFDPDNVSIFNVGRQAFFPPDVGRNKAETIINRINRTYGFMWQSSASFFSSKHMGHIDIVITCVDNMGTREIASCLTAKATYWIDLGNKSHIGQVILGTLKAVGQPAVEGALDILPTVLDLHPDMRDHDTDDQPSCSMAEALAKQDLCINSMLAEWTRKIIWSMVRDYRLEFHGVYVNLKTLSTTPIRIKPVERRPAVDNTPVKSSRSKNRGGRRLPAH